MTDQNATNGAQKRISAAAYRGIERFAKREELMSFNLLENKTERARIGRYAFACRDETRAA